MYLLLLQGQEGPVSTCIIGATHMAVGVSRVHIYEGCQGGSIFVVFNK